MKCICNHPVPHTEIQVSNLNILFECKPLIDVFITQKSAFQLLERLPSLYPRTAKMCTNLPSGISV